MPGGVRAPWHPRSTAVSLFEECRHGFDVVIAGAGPNGLMLACELRLAGVHPVVLERLTEPSPENRANGLIGQVVRMLDRRGLYQPLAGESGPPQPMPAFFFGAVPMDLHTLDDNPVHLLPVPQTRIERVLADRAAELGVEVRRGHELTGLSQHADAVTVEVVGPTGRYEISSRYVVGADGAHSTTCKLAGIEFPGAASDNIVLRIAEVAVPDEFVDPASGGLNLLVTAYISPMYHRTERGAFAYARLPSRPDIVFTLEWTTVGFDNDTPMMLEEVHDSICRVMGADLPLRPPEGRASYRLDRSIGVNTRLPTGIATAGCCLSAMPPTCTSCSAGQDSTSVFRTRSTSAGSWRLRSRAGRLPGSWTPTAPSGARSVSE